MEEILGIKVGQVDADSGEMQMTANKKAREVGRLLLIFKDL